MGFILYHRDFIQRAFMVLILIGSLCAIANWIHTSPSAVPPEIVDESTDTEYIVKDIIIRYEDIKGIRTYSGFNYVYLGGEELYVRINKSPHLVKNYKKYLEKNKGE